MCINAGNNAYVSHPLDVEGNARIRAYGVDIGACESPYALINASAGANGSITPSGRVAVALSSEQVFSSSADNGYYVSAVKRDGVSQGALTLYHLRDVASNHTVVAEFTVCPPGPTNVINASAGYGGTIEPVGVVFVTNGGSQVFTITPDPKYAAIEDVTVDGGSEGPVAGYTFLNVNADHVIEAVFLTYPDTNGFGVADIQLLPSNRLRVEWRGEGGWRYNLVCTPTLTPPAWSNVAPFTNLPGLTEMVITNDITGSDQMYYRLTATEE